MDLIYWFERWGAAQSFGFTVPDKGQEWKGKLRELRAVMLYEISVILAWPAYDGTVVQARSKSAPGMLDYRLRLMEMSA